MARKGRSHSWSPHCELKAFAIVCQLRTNVPATFSALTRSLTTSPLLLPLPSHSLSLSLFVFSLPGRASFNVGNISVNRNFLVVKFPLPLKITISASAVSVALATALPATATSCSCSYSYSYSYNCEAAPAAGKAPPYPV